MDSIAYKPPDQGRRHCGDSGQGCAAVRGPGCTPDAKRDERSPGFSFSGHPRSLPAPGRSACQPQLQARRWGQAQFYHCGGMSSGNRFEPELDLRGNVGTHAEVMPP